MSDQAVFPNMQPPPERQRRKHESTEHEKCELELDNRDQDNQVYKMLRCRLDSSHRVSLMAGVNRKSILVQLLGRDELVGKAKEEAEKWRDGKTPWPFRVSGITEGSD